jgi:hypothetical protein
VPGQLWQFDSIFQLAPPGLAALILPFSEAGRLARRAACSKTGIAPAPRSLRILAIFYFLRIVYITREKID